MKNLLNDYNVSRRELYKGFARFRTDINQGDSLISFFQQFFDLSKAIALATFLKVWIPAINLYVAFGIIIVWFLIKVISKLVVSNLYKKSGAWKVDSEYVAKSEHMNPFNLEVRNQLEEIAKKVGAKITFEKF